jgi:PIN domain nuclease of toxin-antitoxin system
MRLLLHTHLFLWAVADSRRLKAAVRRQMLAAAKIYVSAASIWEIAIKARLGKIQGDPARLAQAIGDSGFVELPVSVEHAARVAQLPLHHNDPFDRLLIAQAATEPLLLLTADATLAKYGELVKLV